MKKLSFLLLSSFTLLASCGGPKTPYSGTVTKVHWNNTAEVLTKTKNGTDTVIECHPTDRYQRFQVGQQLTVYCNKYLQTTRK